MASTYLLSCKTSTNKSNVKDIVDSKFTYWGQKIKDSRGVEEDWVFRGECLNVLVTSRSSCKNIGVITLKAFRKNLAIVAYEMQVSPLEKSINAVISERANQLLVADAEWVGFNSKIDEAGKKATEITAGSGSVNLVQWNNEIQKIQKTELPLNDVELLKASAGIVGSEAFLNTHPDDQVTKDILTKLKSNHASLTSQRQEKLQRVQELQKMIAQQNSELEQLYLQLRDLRDVKLVKKRKDAEAIAEQEAGIKTETDQLRLQRDEINTNMSSTIEMIVDRIKQENVGFELESLTEKEQRTLGDYLKDSDSKWQSYQL